MPFSSSIHLGSSINYFMHCCRFKFGHGFMHPSYFIYFLLVTLAEINLKFLCKYVGLYRLSFLHSTCSMYCHMETLA
jgi:hypothetical protein